MSRWLILIGLVLLASGVQAEDLPADQKNDDSQRQAGDPSRGRLIFGPCRSCHSLERDAAHGFGPNLHRIFGKVAGAQAQFNGYSAGLQAAAFVWTPRRLDEWLAHP